MAALRWATQQTPEILQFKLRMWTALLKFKMLQKDLLQLLYCLLHQLVSSLNFLWDVLVPSDLLLDATFFELSRKEIDLSLGGVEFFIELTNLLTMDFAKRIGIYLLTQSLIINIYAIVVAVAIAATAIVATREPGAIKTKILVGDGYTRTVLLRFKFFEKLLILLQ